MRKIIITSIVLILVITVLELPAPVGFETRPQDHVSLWWLALFGATVLAEILTLRLVRSRSALGAKLGILVGLLNIAMVVADQLHLMQPEVATTIYIMLEDGVVLISLVLLYASWRSLREA